MGENGEARGPNLEKALTAYTDCLALSREYMNTISDKEEEVDLDRLQQFLEVRSELVSLAENSLAGFDSPVQNEASGQKELSGKIISMLEEITELEANLTVYLKSQLSKMKTTIDQMHKSQPVFKRYSHLGGPMHPSRISRHE